MSRSNFATRRLHLRKQHDFNTFVTRVCYGKERMANPAFRRPDMPGPQPIGETKVTAGPVLQAEPLQQASSGELPDRIFKYAMVACGLAVLGLLALIIYELMLRSDLSWHAFGFRFFATSNWDPVQEQFGAFPFIYETVVSSLLALIIAVPLAV